MGFSLAAFRPVSAFCWLAVVSSCAVFADFVFLCAGSLLACLATWFTIVQSYCLAFCCCCWMCCLCFLIADWTFRFLASCYTVMLLDMLMLCLPACISFPWYCWLGVLLLICWLLLLALLVGFWFSEPLPTLVFVVVVTCFHVTSC